MRTMRSEYVRGASFPGYGVSLALGIGVPIPVLSPEILKRTTVRDAEIFAPVIDYSVDYPQKTGKVLGKLSYASLRSGKVDFSGKEITTGSLSSYATAKEIAEILKAEIRDGSFILAQPSQKLPSNQSMKPLKIQGAY